MTIFALLMYWLWIAITRHGLHATYWETWYIGGLPRIAFERDGFHWCPAGLIGWTITLENDSPPG